MKIPATIIPIILVLLLTSSCEKELDIEYHDIAPITVIEGELTSYGIRVGITMTTPMDEPMYHTRLTDATVTLTDLTAGRSYSLTADPDGYFTDNVAGITGHNYRLTVGRDGKIYQAETIMYPPTKDVTLGFNWIKMPYDHVAVLQGQFSDYLGNDDYYWVKIYRNNEMYRWLEMPGTGAVDGLLTFIIMTTRKDTDEEEDDTVLFDGDIITATICPISRDMYDYLEALQNNSNGPAMFTGEKCLGYFMASSPVSSSVVFRPDEIPVYR